MIAPLWHLYVLLLRPLDITDPAAITSLVLAPVWLARRLAIFEFLAAGCRFP